MNFIMKPMTPRTPIPRRVILVDVVKSSLLGLLMSFRRRPTDSRELLRGKCVVSGWLVADRTAGSSFKFTVAGLGSLT